jgi:hypothetical protein
MRVLKFLTSSPILYLEDGWGLLFEPLAFYARVLKFMTSAPVLYLEDRCGLFFEPLAFCARVFKEYFAPNRSLDEEPRLEQIFTWFYGDEGGSALGRPFWQV